MAAEARLAVLIAIDVGTTSRKVCAFDAVSRVRVFEISVGSAAGSASAQSLQADIEAGIDAALVFCGSHGFDVDGVALCTLAMTWLGVDVDNTAVTPLFTYASTSAEAVHHAERLRAALGLAGTPEVAYARTGTPIHVAYAPAHVLALYARDPAFFARVQRWRTLGSQLYSHWFACDAPVSFSEASWTGFLNPAALTWEPTLLAHMPPGTAAALPPLADAVAGRLQGLSASYAARWPALANVPFSLAVGDGVGATLGSHCTDSSRVALTVGTSAAARVVLPRTSILAVPQEVAIPPGLWCYVVDRERVLVGGALTDGGSVVSWAEKVSPPAQGIESFNQMPSQVIVLPFLSPERAPGWNVDVPFTMVGAPANAADFVAACRDGVAGRLAAIFDRLSTLLCVSRSLKVVVSGAAIEASDAWQECVCNALGVPLWRAVQPTTGHASARGVVDLCFPAARDHCADDLELLATPVPALQAAYADYRLRQQRLYDTVSKAI